MKKKRPWRARPLRGKPLFALAGLIALLLVLEYRLRPVIEDVAAYQAQVFAARTVNDAILEELGRDGVGYGSLVRLSRNSLGNVTSIESDVAEINRLKARVTGSVIDKLEGLGTISLLIPAGTLLGNEFTSGRGPMVELKIYPAGYVRTEIYSQFIDAGINQTHHEVMLSVGIQMTAVVPGYSIKCESSSSYCVAQTVIVGEIPDTYVRLDGGGAPFVSKIGGLE